MPDGFSWPMTHSSNGTDTLASRGREGSSSTVVTPRATGSPGSKDAPRCRVAASPAKSACSSINRRSRSDGLCGRWK
jgi:hypothetical protein